jgi:hypothetical protein
MEKRSVRFFFAGVFSAPIFVFFAPIFVFFTQGDVSPCETLFFAFKAALATALLFFSQVAESCWVVAPMMAGGVGIPYVKVTSTV